MSVDVRFYAGFRRAVLLNLLPSQPPDRLIVLVCQHGFGSDAIWGIGRTG